MRFSIAAVLAFATTALCQVEGFNVITKPTEGEQVPAGSTYQIVWQPTAKYPGEITIGLLGGSSPKTLTVVDTIAKGVDPSTGSYDWKVPATLGDMATYGIMITLESDASILQYGFPFKITADDSGEDDHSTSTTSASATASTTETESESSSTTSSAVTSTRASSTTSFSVPSSTIVSSTIRGNLSTTAGRQTTVTSITSIVTDKPSSTASSTSSIATNGVASLAAGSFAMLGGVAMAVLAL